MVGNQQKENRSQIIANVKNVINNVILTDIGG